MKCDELEKFDAASNADLSAGYDHRYAYEADEVDAAIAELKKKLDDAWATVAFNHLDAVTRERRLRMALWLARAERAKDNAIRYGIYGPAIKSLLWSRVDAKCLKKAEEYK